MIERRGHEPYSMKMNQWCGNREKHKRHAAMGGQRHCDVNTANDFVMKPNFRLFIVLQWFTCCKSDRQSSSTAIQALTVFLYLLTLSTLTSMQYHLNDFLSFYGRQHIGKSLRFFLSKWVARCHSFYSFVSVDEMYKNVCFKAELFLNFHFSYKILNKLTEPTRSPEFRTTYSIFFQLTVFLCAYFWHRYL